MLEKKKYFVNLVVIGICMAGWSIGTNAGVFDAELRAEQFFQFELDSGDRLVHDGPYQYLSIEGPTTVEWSWVDGALYMKSAMGEVKVRPLEAFPKRELSENGIIQARARYVSVPFIDEWLEGIPEPSNAEWAEAYEAWFVVRAQFSKELRTQFVNDSRDPSLVAVEFAEQAGQHKLVVPGTVRVEHEEGGRQIDLWLQLKGMPNRPDGSPEEVILILSKDWREPAPRPTIISREDALIFHHGINTLFESSKGPLVVKLGKGLSISTSEGRK